MSHHAQALSCIAALALATPVAAQAPAPTTTAFDGTYVGVSRESAFYAQDLSRGCRASGAPSALTITNGAARTRDGPWEGSVSPQGWLVMRKPDASRLDGHIDRQGIIRGETSSSQCLYTLIWEKMPAPTTAFDGTYAGISRTSQPIVGPTGGCVPDGPPPPLTTVNGIARTLWGRPAVAEGSVGKQGVLVMQAPSGYRFDGQIDGKGTITGRFTLSGACSYQMVYQKKSN